MSAPDPTEEFVFLLGRHERLLRGYLRALIPHAQDADDVLQETKLRLWRAFDQFERGTNFAAWSRKVAFHQVLAFRKRKKRDRLEFSEQFLNVVADEYENHEPVLMRRDQLLQECLAKLPGDHRQVLHLRYAEQCSLDDMASKLQRTVAAIYRQLSRVRQALHQCVEKSLMIEEEGYEPRS
ncbi:sigma-70 family RNA polymerase sigma factor [Phragmitibacter flavus]|uniref:Sigma-70 family RNA polymerase sigma factor n=1 Tax=Phragmitibacter flavus TaxID=2576071 RepID=A0A5R8KEP5_9BACT|nr:sigma-70 family RNA polymerase sigma factor [Phragmitibacter flavus]TLD70773.1 sigma-70 family RNA polymerase sigma factor [Phragmitibacter flavus]